MQGVNKIYFEKSVNFSYSADESVRERYCNSIIDAFELACPGWFDNIELEKTYDSNNHDKYVIKLIIDNIQLLRFRIETSSYNWPTFVITTYYNNGNNSFTPYLSGADSYSSSKTNYISALIYSKNFCAIETSSRSGTQKVSTTIVLCKSNENNTVVIMPSVEINNSNTTNNDLLTAYYGTSSGDPHDSWYMMTISAHTVYSSFILAGEDYRYGKSNNKFLNNYLKSSSYKSVVKQEAPQSRTFINTRVILTQMYITGRTHEYCPDVYYVQNIPVTLTPACNTVLEVGKDFYFTNGVIAVKLT